MPASSRVRLARRPESPVRRVMAAACAALLAIVLASLVVSISYEGPVLSLSLDRGTVFVSTRANPQPEGWSVGWASTTPRFLFNLFPSFGSTAPRPVWRGWFPLWIPLLLLGLLTLALWWRERRPFPPGRCPACGYDARGNVSGRCPECGRAL